MWDGEDRWSERSVIWGRAKMKGRANGLHWEHSAPGKPLGLLLKIS